MLERIDKVDKFKSPGICYYEPKYNLIENNHNILPFKVRVNKNDPKYRIQKIWRSYNVYSDYQIVNLKKK